MEQPRPCLRAKCGFNVKVSVAKLQGTVTNPQPRKTQNRSPHNTHINLQTRPSDPNPPTKEVTEQEQGTMAQAQPPGDDHIKLPPQSSEAAETKDPVGGVKDHNPGGDLKDHIPVVDVKKDQNPGGDVKNPGDVSFRFNAQAPEFVPRAQSQTSVNYYYPCVQFLGGAAAAPDWVYLGDQEPLQFFSGPSFVIPNCSKNFLSDDLRNRIIKQVEYQLSDMSLLANESMVKHMNKDPEGYVPIPVIASSKKLKSLTGNNHHMLVQALQSSTKLVVSSDGKKVKRKIPFTDRDKEDLQSRTVVAENLPEDHSHQNLEKIFKAIGSVKTVRVWHPQESNASRPKGDYLIGNKLHALVEYETSDLAEKAVEKLNDERNWRKGLRVRLLLRRSPKSVLKSRRSEFDGILDDDEPESSEDNAQPHSADLLPTESNAEEMAPAFRKGWDRGRGRFRSRTQSFNGRGLLAYLPHNATSASIHNEGSGSFKQVTKGPRMPDGTRGFAIGRGKPISTPSLTTTSAE